MAATGVWIMFAQQLLAALDLPAIPIISVILFVVVWSILAFLLDRIVLTLSGSKEAQNSLIGRTVLAFGSASKDSRQRFYFLLLLLVSIYLGIISIAAIPSLSKAVTQKIDTGQLEQRLNGIKIQSDQFVRRFPEDLPKLQKYEETNQRKGTSNSVLALDWLADSSESHIRRLPDAWKRLRQFYQRRQDELIEAAKAEYELGNLNRLESRVQSQHYISLIDWYRGSIREMEERLDDCRSSIVKVHTAFGTLSKSRNRGNDSLAVVLPEIFSAQSEAEYNCGARASDYNELPKRGDLGSELGPFGWPMLWLLKAESLPLALIVGLIGFGIFGASVSSMVRHSIAGDEANSK